MRTHNLKLDFNYCDAVMSGEKTFEIRYNDRGYQKGDRIQFKPVNDSGLDCWHPIVKDVFEITYLIHGYGLKDNWCVFGIRKIADQERTYERE